MRRGDKEFLLDILEAWKIRARSPHLFSIFRQYIDSLTYRNRRLKLRHLSLRTDLLKERCQTTGIDFRYLMQADFILLIRAKLYSDKW
ncbi:MAG: hypothetical protein ACTSV7_13185 [Candidatus Baldrarchaeia archaeon]